MPKEFADLAEQYPIITYKSFYYVGKIEAKHLNAENLPELVMDYWHTARPVKDFLTKALY
ncbi:MAG: hypothetical protein AAF519_05690 [Bacteroidota bacterium]